MSIDIEGRRHALASRYPTWVPRTLGDFVGAQAERYGDRPLDERTLSYSETDAWATRLADGLVSVGVRPGDRVGIIMANYLQFAPMKFAIARAGAVAIRFNFLYRTDELAYVLRQSRCHVLVTMTSFAGLDQLAMLDEIAPRWEHGPTEALPDLRHVVLFRTDERDRDGVLTLNDLARMGEAAPGSADASSVSPFDDADILYTSGTPVRPKAWLSRTTQPSARRDPLAPRRRRWCASRDPAHQGRSDGVRRRVCIVPTMIRRSIVVWKPPGGQAENHLCQEGRASREGQTMDLRWMTPVGLDSAGWHYAPSGVRGTGRMKRCLGSWLGRRRASPQGTGSRPRGRCR